MLSFGLLCQATGSPVLQTCWLLAPIISFGGVLWKVSVAFPCVFLLVFILNLLLSLQQDILFVLII